MKSKNISKSLQVQVMKYLDFVHYKEAVDSQNYGEQILDKVSKELKDKVLLEFYGKILDEHNIFKITFSKKFLKRLALKMKERIFGPGEIIYR